MPGTLPQLEERLSSILAKIDAFPLDKIVTDLRTSIATFDKLIKDSGAAVNRFNADVTPEIKPALQAFKEASASAAKAIDSTEATLLSPAAPAQQELRNALQEFSRAARSLRVLLDYLQQNPSALIRGKTEENR
jgi:paraquat-inducible protein B